MDDAVRRAVVGPGGSLLPDADQGSSPVSPASTGWLSAVVRHASAQRIDLFAPHQRFQSGEHIWWQPGIDKTGKTVTIHPLANLGRVLAQRYAPALHSARGLPWAGTTATALRQTAWPFVPVPANVYGIPQSIDLVGSARDLEALGPGDGVVAASPAVSDWLQAVGCGTEDGPAVNVIGADVAAKRLPPGERAAARALLGLSQSAFLVPSGERSGICALPPVPGRPGSGRARCMKSRCRSGSASCGAQASPPPYVVAATRMSGELWRHPRQRAAPGEQARRHAVHVLDWRHRLAAYPGYGVGEDSTISWWSNSTQYGLTQRSLTS